MAAAKAVQGGLVRHDLEVGQVATPVDVQPVLLEAWGYRRRAPFGEREQNRRRVESEADQAHAR